MEDCIFCKLAKGEIPTRKIYEDKEVVAILDINPHVPGHSLVIPKKHFANIHDVPEQVLTDTMKGVKKVAGKMMDSLKAEGVNLLQNNGRAAGQLVEHIHFHVLPRHKDDGIVFHFPHPKLTDEQMKEMQDKLRIDEKKPGYSTGFSNI